MLTELDNGMNVTYTFGDNNNDIIITGLYKGDGVPSDKLIIPEEIDGYPVTSISNRAFRLKTDINEVHIPDNVSLIGDGAFGGCGLKKLTFAKSSDPTKKLEIQRDAFIYNKITELVLPDKRITLSEGAFSNNNISGELVIHKNIGNIGMSCFQSNNISSIKFETTSESFTKLQYYTFFGNPIPYVQLPVNIRLLQEDAFPPNTIIMMSKKTKYYESQFEGAVILVNQAQQKKLTKFIANNSDKIDTISKRGENISMIYGEPTLGRNILKKLIEGGL